MHIYDKQCEIIQKIYLHFVIFADLYLENLSDGSVKKDIQH